jgi:ribosome-associated protein
VTATAEAIELTRAAAHAADEKLARAVVAFDVSEQLAIADVFLVCSGNSERQVDAIVDAIEEALREQFDRRPLRREGTHDSHWVLLDYLDVVVHVQHQTDREFYDLERLWKDCPSVPLPHEERLEESS